MKSVTKKTVTLSVTLLALTCSAEAAELTYSFPSPGGAQLGATPSPQFVPPAADGQSDVRTGVVLTSTTSVTDASALGASKVPLPVAARGYGGDYGRSEAAAAFAYRFITHALGQQSFSNYSADYYRLFTPGYAVSTWTDRVYGMVDVGYGSVDGWTSGVYGLNRVGGRSYGRNSPPDLSTMPKLKRHPELEKQPSFSGN